MPRLSTITGFRLWLGLAAFGLACSSEPQFKGTALPANIPAADFTLTDQNGAPFTLSAQRGKVVLLFFGFTYCPDVCPLTLSTWRKVERKLGADADRVAFVYVTVDPERDTPARLKEHLAVFSPRFIGLTGTPEQLNAIYGDYGIYREKERISDEPGGYVINHSSYILLLDKQGRWRLNHTHDASPEDLVHDINLLLDEAAS